MSNYETNYLDLCKYIIEEGDHVSNRTGVSTYSIFGVKLSCDLAEGLPLLTTKKINPVLPIGELLWMLSGKTDLPSLRKYQNKPEGSHTIWSDDFEKYKQAFSDSIWYEGQTKDKCVKSFVEREELGNIYGKQLRKYKIGDARDNSFLGSSPVFHDQLITLISNIKAVREDIAHPMARRLICSFWNPYDHTTGDKVTCALPACHTDFQCIIRDGKLNLRYAMRSNDVFLGNPFNAVFYATLCHVLAKLTDLSVGELLYFGTDVHIYSNHIEQVKEQLSRKIKPLPKLILPEFDTLEELLMLTGEDFKLEGYDPHPFIKAPQAS